MEKKKKNNIIKHHGYSLHEVVIALYILSMSLLSVFSLMLQNIQVQTVNKDIIVASQLAQEGIELVRQKRDTNWVREDSDWKEGPSQFSDYDIVQDGDFAIDYNGDIDINADLVDDTEARLWYDANGFFVLPASGVSASPYYRLIEVSETPPDKINVKCHIQWTRRGRVKNYIVETNLYNWR